MFISHINVTMQRLCRLLCYSKCTNMHLSAPLCPNPLESLHVQRLSWIASWLMS